MKFWIRVCHFIFVFPFPLCALILVYNSGSTFEIHYFKQLLRGKQKALYKLSLIRFMIIVTPFDSDTFLVVAFMKEQ